MLETELIKLGIFLAIVGIVTFSVIALIKIDEYIEKRFYSGNRYKNCLHW